MIVAVLASSGPKSPVTPYRFVHNLAGGNHEYTPPDSSKYGMISPTEDHPSKGDYDDYVYDLEMHTKFLVTKAQEVLEYWSKYAVVSD